MQAPMIKLGFWPHRNPEVDTGGWENRELNEMLDLALDMMTLDQYEAFKLAWRQRKLFLPAPPCVCLAEQERDGLEN